jgi:hypothetical protein
MGRLLLTLLVVTGLAGTEKNTTLTKQERKIAITDLKDTKANLLKSVKGLSEAQLNFKTAPDRWSIKECVYHITLSEQGLWGMLEAGMKAPATTEKRAEIKMTDEDWMKGVTNRSNKQKAPEPFQPEKATWKSTEEAFTAFKVMRAEHLKYAKNTTEDLRNHVLQLPFGMIDCYQFILFTSGHCNRHTQQINEIKADPNFPK